MPPPRPRQQRQQRLLALLTPDIRGVWSIDVDAKASSHIGVHSEARAIVGKAVGGEGGGHVEGDRRQGAMPIKPVSGRLDRIDTAEDSATAAPNGRISGGA